MDSYRLGICTNIERGGKEKIRGDCAGRRTPGEVSIVQKAVS